MIRMLLLLLLTLAACGRGPAACYPSVNQGDVHGEKPCKPIR